MATYPSHLHGIKLGSFFKRARQSYHANHLTTKNSFLEKYHIHWDYELIGNFIFSFTGRIQENYNDDLRVSVKPHFVIPSEHKWPEDLWGVKLGTEFQYWRTHKDTLSSNVLQALNEREFLWDVNEYEFQTLVIA